MKAALIALALLAPLPAAAATVVIDFNPAVLQVQFPAFYNVYEPDYERFAFHQTGIDLRNFYFSFPPDTLLIETNSATSPGFAQPYNAFYFSYDGFGGYGVYTAVPEPSTWALMLFGFAFFAIKGIWPARARHE